MNNPSNDNTTTTNSDATATGNSSGVRPAITAADVPWQLKAKYFSSGVAVGVFASPLVRKAAAILKTAYSQAEGVVEKSSEFVAKAKDRLRTEEDDVVPHVHRHD